MRLGVDIDGVVCEFQEAYNRWVARMYDLPVIPIDRFDWYLAYPNGARLWSAAHSEGIAEDIYMSAAVTPDAVEVLKKASEDWEIRFITYRPARLAPITNEWLDRHDLPYPVTHTDDKASVPCDLYVDDHPQTITSLHRAGRKALLFRRPWNREAWDLPGVWNWQSLRRRLALSEAA